eukprot:3600590-Rhodomonas_salina.2
MKDRCSARTCSLYATTSSLKVMLRNAAFSTLGEIDSVQFVGLRKGGGREGKREKEREEREQHGLG